MRSHRHAELCARAGRSCARCMHRAGGCLGKRPRPGVAHTCLHMRAWALVGAAGVERRRETGTTQQLPASRCRGLARARRRVRRHGAARRAGKCLKRECENQRTRSREPSACRVWSACGEASLSFVYACIKNKRFARTHAPHRLTRALVLESCCGPARTRVRRQHEVVVCVKHPTYIYRQCTPLCAREDVGCTVCKLRLTVAIGIKQAACPCACGVVVAFAATRIGFTR